MPWWDKAVSAGKEAAEKAGFEANKLVRVQTEERNLSELRNKVQGKLADLGQIALTLYRNGSLTDPTISSAAQDLAALEAQITEQQAKVEAARADQYHPAGQPAAPVPTAAPTPVSTATPAPPMSAAPMEPPPVAAPPPADAAPEMIQCPNCGSQVRPTAAFCPECGNKMR